MRPPFAKLSAATAFGVVALSAHFPAHAGEFDVTGSAHYYYRDFDRTLPAAGGETSEIRRLRPSFEYKGNGWSARFVPDLVRDTNQALDAYLAFAPGDTWDLTVGRFKSSTSIDQLKSSNVVAATETSLVASMTPNRDNGILFGYGGSKTLPWRWEVGLFDGAADDEVKGSLDGGAEWSTRVLRNVDLATGTLRFGLGLSGGTREGEPGDARLARYRSVGRSTWFRYRGDAYADGSTGRVLAFADYYGGPVYAQLEAVQSRETVRLGDTRTSLAHRGWEAQAGYVLTGDDRTYRGVKPGNFVLPGLDLPLAVELTGRVGRAVIDDDAFDVVADPASNGRSADLAALSLGLWFPNKWRLTSEYAVTRVDNAAGGGEQSERLLVMSLIMVF